MYKLDTHYGGILIEEYEDVFGGLGSVRCLPEEYIHVHSTLYN